MPDTDIVVAQKIKGVWALVSPLIHPICYIKGSHNVMFDEIVILSIS